MKKTVLLILILAFVFALSCKKDEPILPVASFQISMLDTCYVPTKVQFTNTSTSAKIYRWNFGDGSKISYAKDTVYTFAQEGVYEVELTAYGNGGMSTFKKQIYIVNKPVVSFTADDTSVRAGDTVKFSTVFGGGVLPPAWSWSFGDGYQDVVQNPSHVYKYPGKYSVYFTAVNACGPTTIEKKDYITVDSVYTIPAVEFHADRLTVAVGQIVNFYDYSTNQPNTWSWSFPGGTPSNSSSQHVYNVVYTNTGTYDVTLTAGNQAGNNTKTKNAYITVVNPPIADFNADMTTINEGQAVNFTDISLNNPTYWSWTFQGGNPSTSTDANPANITYTTSGNYDVTLYVSNQYGSNTLTKTAYIKVNSLGSSPVANFVANDEYITPGQQINFTDLSLNAPNAWNWSFNGASIANSTVQNPTGISWASTGDYTVSLTVSNNIGSDNETKISYIHVGLAPVANFTANDYFISTGESINFTDISTNTPTAWSWSFSSGNPSTSTVQNPSNITFNLVGTFAVTLNASNAFGSSTKTAYVHVGKAPVAEFFANQTVINAGQSISFTDQSSNSPSNWQWSFPGATQNSSTLQNPTNITYNNPGTYAVTLTAGNNFGTNTRTKTNYITVNGSATSAMITNITVNQMPPPPYPPGFFNLFYKLTDFTPTTYINNSTVHFNTTPPTLPKSWTLNFAVPVLNKMYKIEFYDKRQMTENLINYISFNLNNYPNRPPKITINQVGFSVDIYITWN